MSLTQLIVRDPEGERALPLPLRLGGTAPDLKLPEEIAPGLSIEMRGQRWWLRTSGAAIRVNGRLREADCQLADGDVFEVGGAQLSLRTSEPARLAVYPLRGNETIAPLQIVQVPGEEIVAGTREIRVAGGDDSGIGSLPVTDRTPLPRSRVVIAATVFAILALLGAALWWIIPVPLQVSPAAATVEVRDSMHWRSASRLFLLRGERVIEVASPGYRTEQRQLSVVRALSSAPAQRFELALLPGILKVDTGELAAEVFVDGEPFGSAPGKIEVAAGKHNVLVRAPRHVDFITEIEVQGAGREQALVAKLAPAWGWLTIDTRPGAARVFIDGQQKGATPQRLELDSGLHALEVRAPGRRTWRSQVAIVAGQTLELGVVDLAAPPPAVIAQATPASSSPAATPEAGVPSAAPPAPRTQSALLGQLILVPAGSYPQGSDRREQGRRANETLRTVTLTRPFYMSEREVSNAQFRAFRSAHASGIAADRTLDLDAFAVSSVSWDDAVAFCNWLSQREGLPLAYERRDGRWQLVNPANHGYRLPTEAEWEYAARYVDGRRWRRYAWGDELPPPAAAENLAGAEINARVTVAARAAPVLPGYRDEHVVVAPTGTYGRSALGFADLGGNVSEWVQDTYESLLPPAPVTDPVGDAASAPHVIRGASWRTTTVQELRLAWRDRASGPQQWLGFRVARGVEGN